MTRRKIVFVIVEGPSDETALGLLLQRLYQAETVYVHIVRGDITTGHRAGPENIVQRVGRLIQRYAQTNHLRKGDFREILHVSDMDGAFIDPDYVYVEDTLRRTRYSPEGIYTANKPGIEERNRQKKENLLALIHTEKIWGVPYRIFYMSCNLDHALYGKLNSSNADKEKEIMEVK